MRQRTVPRHFSLIAAALAAAALGGCKNGGGYASSDSTAMKVDSAAGRADTAPMSTASPDSGTPPGRWADASVLGFATVANRGEIALGTMGEHMATNPAVKSFGRLLVIDHEKMLASASDLASKLATMADTAAGDARDLASHDAEEITNLSGKAKGADWDKEFLDEAIEGHQKILAALQDATHNSPSATVRAALEQEKQMVEEHLTKAQNIRTTLKD